MTPEEIREFRYKHRLSQKTLASMLDVTRESVVAWESGKRKPSGQSEYELNKLKEELEK